MAWLRLYEDQFSTWTQSVVKKSPGSYRMSRQICEASVRLLPSDIFMEDSAQRKERSAPSPSSDQWGRKVVGKPSNMAFKS
jgi:hypothetical protein